MNILAGPLKFKKKGRIKKALVIILLLNILFKCNGYIKIHGTDILNIKNWLTK